MSSAAQNAPPAGERPAGGAFCTADKQKKHAEKVNKLGTVQHFHETVGSERIKKKSLKQVSDH